MHAADTKQQKQGKKGKKGGGGNGRWWAIAIALAAVAWGIKRVHTPFLLPYCNTSMPAGSMQDDLSHKGNACWRAALTAIAACG